MKCLWKSTSDSGNTARKLVLTGMVAIAFSTGQAQGRDSRPGDVTYGSEGPGMIVPSESRDQLMEQVDEHNDWLAESVFGITSSAEVLQLSLARGDGGGFLKVVAMGAEGRLAAGQLTDIQSFQLPTRASLENLGGSDVPVSATQRRTAMAGMLIGDLGSVYVFGIATEYAITVGEENLDVRNLAIVETGATLAEVVELASDYVIDVEEGERVSGGSPPLVGFEARCAPAVGGAFDSADTQVPCSTCTANYGHDLFYMDRIHEDCIAHQTSIWTATALSCLTLPNKLLTGACLVASAVGLNVGIDSCNDELNITWRQIEQDYQNCVNECDPFSPPGNHF